MDFCNSNQGLVSSWKSNLSSVQKKTMWFAEPLCRPLIAHYNDVIIGAIASQIISLTIVYATVYSDADKKYQSSASLAFVRGISRRPVNSPHKWPVTRKMFPFDDVIIFFSVSIAQIARQFDRAIFGTFFQPPRRKMFFVWRKTPRENTCKQWFAWLVVGHDWVWTRSDSKTEGNIAQSVNCQTC